MCFLFKPLSRAFSNRCVFHENAKRISVDGTPKLVEREGCLKPVDRRKQAVTFSSPEMRYIWPAPPIERARKLVPE